VAVADRRIDLEASYIIAPLAEGKTRIGAVITVRDITEKKRFAAEQRLAAAVFDNSLDGLVVADARLRATKVNAAFRRVAGLGQQSVNGQPLADVLKVEPRRMQEVLDQLASASQTEWEQWLGTAAHRRAWRIGMSAVRDDKGKIQHYVAAVSDITARKIEEEKIVFQATYDQLTGLPNRTLFNDRLQRLVLEARRAKSNIGLMFIDLDGFKAINDNLGHDSGDLLLKATAERLLKCVREADTVARLGGDEFTVIMPLLDSLDGATRVAGRILMSLTQPFDLNGQEGRVSASIGISMFPAHAGDAERLLHNADVAMYHAKRHGKANFQVWRQEFETGAEARY
jgi:diguanylate cyclase (GGDEF)-like protein/PAS domain S-box-containing protein